MPGPRRTCNLLLWAFRPKTSAKADELRVSRAWADVSGEEVCVACAVCRIAAQVQAIGEISGFESASDPIARPHRYPGSPGVSGGEACRSHTGLKKGLDLEAKSQGWTPR